MQWCWKGAKMGLSQGLGSIQEYEQLHWLYYWEIKSEEVCTSTPYF